MKEIKIHEPDFGCLTSSWKVHLNCIIHIFRWKTFVIHVASIIFDRIMTFYSILRHWCAQIVHKRRHFHPIYNRIFFWLFYCLVHQKVQVIKYSNEICVFSFWLKCDAFHLAFSKCLLVLTLLHDLKTTSNHWIYTNNCLYCMELAFCGLRTTSEQNSIMLWLFKEFTWIWNWCAWHETMCSMLVRMLCRFT